MRIEPDFLILKKTGNYLQCSPESYTYTNKQWRVYAALRQNICHVYTAEQNRTEKKTNEMKISKKKFRSLCVCV